MSSFISNRTRFPLALAACAGIIGFGSGLPGGLAAEPQPVEYRWLEEPALNVQWWPPEAQPVLRVPVERLASPSANDRLAAAQAIVRLGDQASPARAELLQALLAHLKRGEAQAHVRAAYIAAACRLADASHADQLWELAREDAIARPTVERACIDWRSAAPAQLWREQIVAADATDASLVRALEGLGAAGAQSDLPQLLSIVSDPTRAAPIRLAAARAIGRLSQSDQLSLARQLRSSSAENRELLALAVLGQLASPEIEAFVLDLAEHGTPTAQRHAYQWLCELRPDIAQAKASQFIEHADADIRRLSIEQIFKVDSQESLSALGSALNDIHPTVRNRARELLLQRAGQSDEQQRAVEKLIADQLDQDQWRPLEQALRLAVDLSQSERTARLLELLDHERPEVNITAAWALRHLAEDQTTLQAMLEHVQRVTLKLESDAPEPPPIEEPDLRRTAHLLEALGIRRYEPAKATLLKYVPKNNQRMGMITRIAGIWACGKMWAGEENRQLADELRARIVDDSVIVPELDTVRYTAMLALGFLADPKTRDFVAGYGQQGPLPVGAAAAWALQRIDEPRGGDAPAP